MLRFLLTVLALSFVIGCSSEDPLCTDNYCVTGKIFSKDELEAGQRYRYTMKVKFLFFCW